MRLKNKNSYLKINNVKTKKIINNISTPIRYCPSVFGFSKRATGRKVKISLLDSGCPSHKIIDVPSMATSFCSNELTVKDNNGHATVVSGIMVADCVNKIRGFVPNADMYYAKVVDKKGGCRFNSLLAGVLWSIVQDVDIIVIPLGTTFNYGVLHNAILKAFKNNICIIAASGNNIKKENGKLEYPAAYTEVFSVSSSPKKKKIKNRVLSKIDFAVDTSNTISTYIDNKYIKASGSSVATAFIASQAALEIQKQKKNKSDKISPIDVYKKIIKKNK
ncbi:S8 family serine peptidase [Patescibacteria group bacterium]|nr:S8 family serine peptidase [Patescibacteria group bacterium]